MENYQRDAAQATRQSPETRSRDDLKKAYRITAIIGGFIIATLFIYAFIVEMLKANPASLQGIAPMPEIDTLRYVLLGVSAVIFFLIKFISNLFLAGKDPMARTSPAGGIGRSSPYLQRLMKSAIVTYALCESVAIYGLILFIIGRNSPDFYLFMALSLVFFAVYFPRYGRWEEWVSERERTGDVPGA
jgi:hypothetical protein